MKIKKKSASILNKFLIFNFFAFIILGLFTFFYLKQIQPELVKQRTEKHNIIINNTANHIESLQIRFKKNTIKDFLLSTGFLFQPFTILAALMAIGVSSTFSRISKRK